MTIPEMKKLSKAAKERGFIPMSVAERETVLHTLGLRLYKTQEIMDLHSLMINDHLQVWPYKLKVTYVDPQLQVGRLVIEYPQVALEWWVDLESIREAGLAPLMLPDGDMVDMLFLCEEQGEVMYNDMFKEPVDGRWYELETHIKYVFDTLYHTRHQVKLTNETEVYWIDSIIQAQVWMEHFIELGNAKMKNVLETERYQQWCDNMTWVEANKQQLKVVHVNKKRKQKARQLAAKL